MQFALALTKLTNYIKVSVRVLIESNSLLQLSSFNSNAPTETFAPLINSVINDETLSQVTDGA